MDLAKYVANRFGGMTPGQQLAELSMITTKELREARAEAKLLGVSPMVIATANRARALATSLGIDRRDAMAILIKAQADLLPYVHQRQAQAEPVKPDSAKTFVIGMPDPGYNPMVNEKIAPPVADPDGLENAGLFDAMPEQVSQDKSHDVP